MGGEDERKGGLGFKEEGMGGEDERKGGLGFEEEVTKREGKQQAYW